VARTASQCIQVTATIPLGRASGGIAVNPSTDTIYVAVDLNPAVVVISGQTDTVTGTIPVGDMPGAAAVNPRTNIIYVANQDVPSTGFGSVSVLNGRTSKALATIPVGVGPTGVTVDPNTNTAYVANAATNGSPNSVSVLAPCQP
jgi:YVTN family beta-propeller protein